MHGRNSTRIISPNSTQFQNTRSGRPALTLTVKPGAPPMAVNSTVRVNNLNADNVDGYTSSQLRTPYAWVSSDNIQDNVEWSPTIKAIDVPTGGGALLMTGSVQVYNSDSANPGWFSCWFFVDGVLLTSSERTTFIQPNQHGFCQSTAATTLPVGPHTVQFYTNPLASATLQPDSGTWWAIVAPG